MAGRGNPRHRFTPLWAWKGAQVESATHKRLIAKSKGRGRLAFYRPKGLNSAGRTLMPHWHCEVPPVIAEYDVEGRGWSPISTAPRDGTPVILWMAEDADPPVLPLTVGFRTISPQAGVGYWRLFGDHRAPAPIGSSRGGNGFCASEKVVHELRVSAFMESLRLAFFSKRRLRTAKMAVEERHRRYAGPAASGSWSD